MQPAQAEDGGSSSALKKWGPIAAIVAVIAIVAGVLVVTTGGDDDDATDATVPVATEAPVDTSAAETTVADTGATDTAATDSEPATSVAAGGGEVTFPLSFTQAEDQGIDVAWGDNCDPETGRLMVRDFFAPECYAPFEGDNGGETAPGVTADAIKVVYYLGPDDDPIINYITAAIANDDTNADSEATLTTMLDYYKQFYEFYGRTIDLQFFQGSGIASDEVAARADAVRIAEDIKPFAVLGGPALTAAFGDEISSRGILCISCNPSQPDDWYAARDPYNFGITASARQMNVHATEFISKQLAGKNAEYAGDEFTSTPRKYGLVYIESSAESAAIADEFVAQLGDAGIEISERLPYALDPATIQATAAQIISKLKASGITTVIFSGDPVAPGDFTREATTQEYFPEWLLANAALVDTTAFSRTYDQEQWKHAFGISQLSARTLPEVSGYYSLYQWFSGEEAPANDSIGVIVPPLALFAATAQAAGPNLSAQTFHDALYQFETQQAISAPYLTWGDHGYWPGTDYNGIDDATLIWWDPTATGPDEIRKDGTGMWQYVDGGKRYLPGEWPTTVQALFDPTGAVAIYQTPPEGEAPIDYPSPAG